jgi:excisionase family DNA binding protein
MQNSMPSIDTIIDNKIVSSLSGLLDQKFKQYSAANPAPKVYLSVEETAIMLGIKPSTLYNLNLRREIPFHKIGKTLRYKYKDVIDYIESKRVKSNSESQYEAQFQKGRRVRT